MLITPSYLHLSERDVSSVFDKLNSCLYDVQEYMSSSKLNLIPLSLGLQFNGKNLPSEYTWKPLKSN